jgi:hypothetical protein
VRAEGSGRVVEVGGGCEAQASPPPGTIAASRLGVTAQTTITARCGAFGSVGTGHEASSTRGRLRELVFEKLEVKELSGLGRGRKLGSTRHEPDLVADAEI